MYAVNHEITMLGPNFRLMNLNKLLLFTKSPTPGSVKTWVISLLGANASAELHKILTEITVDKIFTAKSRIYLVPKMQLTGTDNWTRPCLKS
jgi:glycosyltransferase A (GT-A) superfamily protein (DUF2064 family)